MHVYFVYIITNEMQGMRILDEQARRITQVSQFFFFFNSVCENTF